jgi:hypothetical protein
MAKRKTPFHPNHVRQKIRATQLINRLMALIDGKITLSISQVRAIDILLKKVVPDLAQTHIAGEVQHRYVVEVPPADERRMAEEISSDPPGGAAGP